MRHWTGKYIGMPWTDEFDCLELARLVLRERYGRVIKLPPNARWRWPAERALEAANEYGRPVKRPNDGDCVLMRIMGRRKCLGSHVGVFVERGSGWALHNIEGLGVRFQPLSALRHSQLEVVGFYRWL